MRSFILLLKRIGLQKIVAVIVAVIIITVAITYTVKLPQRSDTKYQELVNAGQYKTLIDDLEKKIKSNPKDIYSTELLAVAYIQKSESEPATADLYLQKAFELLIKNVSLDKNQDESFRLLGTVYLYQNKLVDAKRSFNKAISINPANLNARAGLGLLAEKENDQTRVLSIYTNIIKMDIQNEMAHLGLARYYMTTKNTDKAMQHARTVLSFTKNNSSIGEANHILGTAFLTFNKPVEAMIFFKESLKYRPEHVQTWVTLGQSYIEIYYTIERKKRDTAIKDATEAANQALLLKPNYIYAHILLHKIQLLQNKYTEANVEAKRIVELLKSDTFLPKSEKDRYAEYYKDSISSVKIKSVSVKEI